MKIGFAFPHVFGLAAALCALPLAAASQGAPAQGGNSPLNAVVKLEVTKSVPNFLCPWKRSDDSAADGSGVVIGPGRILTCAHCVADATLIRIRKHNEDSLYHAAVEFIDNDSDLALVAVGDAAFMADITPMEIGATPAVQADVLAVGYPIGGNGISFTRGIVSRIEDVRYSQGGTQLLGVQVDAAINPGNSGGPVLDMGTGKIGGIAFQGRGDGEALGYMIPTEIIRHFLADVGDGRVDGVYERAFAVTPMENEGMRRAYRMPSGQTGILVEFVHASLGTESLRAGDILLEIDGHKVANNGNIRIEGNEIRSIDYPLYMRQVGETVPVCVLRDGETVQTSIRVAKRNYRVRNWMYDKTPDYFVFGGMVFTTMSYNYLAVSKAGFHDDLFEDKSFDGEEMVVVSAILPDVCMEGFLGCSRSLVRSVNGVKVRNLRHLAELVDGSKEEFLRFAMDRGSEWDASVVVDAKALREATPRVLERYGIASDRSADLK